MRAARYGETAKDTPKITKIPSLTATLRSAAAGRWKKSCHSALHGQSGSAAIEFLTLAMVFMVPLVYLVITVMNMQLASFAAENLGRNIARAYTLNQRSNINTVLHTLLADYGYKSDQVAFSVQCKPDCSPGSDYVVSVTIHLGLPLIPDIFNPKQALSVGSTVTMPISRYQTGGT